MFTAHNLVWSQSLHFASWNGLMQRIRSICGGTAPEAWPWGEFFPPLLEKQVESAKNSSWPPRHFLWAEFDHEESTFICSALTVLKGAVIVCEERREREEANERQVHPLTHFTEYSWCDGYSAVWGPWSFIWSFVALAPVLSHMWAKARVQLILIWLSWTSLCITPTFVTIRRGSWEQKKRKFTSH